MVGPHQHLAGGSPCRVRSRAVHPWPSQWELFPDSQSAPSPAGELHRQVARQVSLSVFLSACPLFSLFSRWKHVGSDWNTNGVQMQCIWQLGRAFPPQRTRHNSGTADQSPLFLRSKSAQNYKVRCFFFFPSLSNGFISTAAMKSGILFSYLIILAF